MKAREKYNKRGKKTMKRCGYCKNYINEECKFCKFEYWDELNLLSDDWDILNLDDDLEWSHLQIAYRLQSKGVQSLFTDIWTDNNIAIVIGANVDTGRLADVLNVHREVVYNDFEHGWFIINLFMEKYLRGYDLTEEIESKREMI